MEIEIKKEMSMTITIGAKEIQEIILDYDGDVDEWLSDIEFEADDIDTDIRGAAKLQKYIDKHKDEIDNCEVCGQKKGFDNLEELKNARHLTGKRACEDCRIKNEDSKNQLYFNIGGYDVKKTA